jgi:hypothetical protein
MGIDKLITMGATMAVIAASTGQLPKAIRTVQQAQFQLIKASQASNWPKALLLPKSKDVRARDFMVRFKGYHRTLDKRLLHSRLRI